METGSPLPRRCGDRCCKGDLPGDFKVTGTIRGACAAKYQFQPNVTGCSYDEVTRGQILGYLEAESSGVLVVGDSMLRQFYLRFIMMLRGQSRLLDHHLQSHAQYRICPEGDMYRVSGNTANESSIDFDNEFLQVSPPRACIYSLYVSISRYILTADNVFLSQCVLLRFAFLCVGKYLQRVCLITETKN